MHIPQVTSSKDVSTGQMGQEYLATGKQVAMRKWEERETNCPEGRSREYETVGYMLSGVLELDLDGQTARLEAGDSWLVPANAKHRYRVIEPIVAVEATSPPARFGEKDEPVSAT